MMEQLDQLPALPLYRQTGGLVYRDDGDQIVEGMVVPFNQWIEIDSIVEGHFMERFAPGSLTKTFSEQVKRMKGYFEHGMSKMFDRMPVMDIREAWEQDDGGFFRANLFDSVPDLLREGLKRGIYGASIGAEIVKMQRDRKPAKSEHNPEGIEERTYTEVKAFDISITPRPAYATAVQLRSIADDLIIERLLEDPKRLKDLILRAGEQEDPKEEEPQHSGREEPEAPAPERSRSTLPVKDYLNQGEETPAWLL